jgi:lanosterol synthase
MTYLYGRRFQTPITPLILELRQELFIEPWHTIPWHTLSNAISPIDLYSPHSGFFTLVSYPLRWLEWLIPRMLPSVREMAVKHLYELVVWEDENTNCQTIGPVSFAFNWVCRFVEEGEK